MLKRPELQLATGLNLNQIDKFLSAFASAAIGVHTHFRWRPQLRDSDDEMVLEAAANGRADLLVTHNIKDFRQATEVFGIPVLTPGQLIQEIPV